MAKNEFVCEMIPFENTRDFPNWTDSLPLSIKLFLKVVVKEMVKLNLEQE